MVSEDTPWCPGGLSADDPAQSAMPGLQPQDQPELQPLGDGPSGWSESQGLEPAELGAADIKDSPQLRELPFNRLLTLLKHISPKVD